MTSVIFGAASSPTTAIYIKNKNAQEHEQVYPAAARAIIRNHYMDDYVHSFVSVKEAVRTAKEVRAVHQAAGFELTQWASNEAEVMRALQSDAAPPPEIRLGHEEKTLGLRWLVAEDRLTFNIGLRNTPPEVADGNQAPTKRQVTSAIMSTFDPLGLAAPIPTKGETKPDTDEEVSKKLASIVATARPAVRECSLPNPERFSSWVRLVRTTAKVIIFINLCKPKLTFVSNVREQDSTYRPVNKGARKNYESWNKINLKLDRKLLPIDSQHYEKAKKLLIKLSQGETFVNKIINMKNNVPLYRSSKRKNIDVQIDEDGILHLRSRTLKLRGLQKLENKPVTLDGRQKAKWKTAQRLADHFWKKWVREYLPTLRIQRLNNNDHVDPRQGVIVIFGDSSLPRNTWPRGEVQNVYRGPDDRARIVDVRTTGGVLRRPTSRLIIMVPAGGRGGEPASPHPPMTAPCMAPERRGSGRE